MPEPNFPVDDCALAESHDMTILETLYDHPNRFVRTRVAMNIYLSTKLRKRMLERTNEQTSVIGALIRNPGLTREEYELLFAQWQGRGYDGNIHPNLASSEHATIDNLHSLLQLRNWVVTMAVLNNRARRLELPTIIKALLPDEDKSWERWTEVEKLAYYRMYGRRFPTQE